MDCVDLGVRQVADHGSYDRTHIDLQLKATAQDLVKPGGYISFTLSKKHYDRLRSEKVYVPRVLVVMIVPPRSDDWLYQHERAMLLRNCAYWVSLRGAPPVASATKTVHVPLSQPFTVSQLLAMLQRVGDGGLP